jgi:hypothetical protein
MSLQALIDLANIRELTPEGMARLELARQRHREYDKKIEDQVAKKAVTNDLLNRTCGL